MASAGVMFSNKLCPELGNRLTAMSWNEIETMIKQFIAEDACQRSASSVQQIISRAKTRDHKSDPIKFLSDLVHDLEEVETYCPGRGIDLRKKTEDQLNFYHGAITPAIA